MLLVFSLFLLWLIVTQRFTEIFLICFVLRELHRDVSLFALEIEFDLELEYKSHISFVFLCEKLCDFAFKSSHCFEFELDIEIVIELDMIMYR